MNSAAQYLLRIDDLCPTVSAEGWARLRALIEEFSLKPILAVVPDNQDPELRVSAPDAGFWEEMRSLEAKGAAVGLHGYRHVCASRGRSLVDLHRTSEFAGAPSETQRTWIGEGLRILRGHGLNPKVWVAPRHGFDAATIDALLEHGMKVLSDGFAQRSFLRRGIIWIPQQHWAAVEKRRGLWTICIHPNTAGEREMAALRRFLTTHAREFTSVDRVLSGSQPDPLTLAERLQAEWALRRSKLSHAVRPMRRLTVLRASSSA